MPKLKATPAGTRDKDHLISVIQAGTGASKKAASETLDALLETVTLSLKKNKKVQLYGFGSFELVKRKAQGAEPGHRRGHQDQGVQGRALQSRHEAEGRRLEA